MSIVTRVNSAYHSPRILIPFRWATSGTVYTPVAGGTPVNPFSVSGSVNPNTGGPNSGPLPKVYATCRAGADGNLTIAVTGGFTPPVTLIAWEFNSVANAWFKLGPAATYTGGFTAYEVAVDATYAQWTFPACESAVVLIQSSAAITGAAYTDGMIDAATIGPAQEGF